MNEKPIYMEVEAEVDLNIPTTDMSLVELSAVSRL